MVIPGIAKVQKNMTTVIRVNIASGDCMILKQSNDLNGEAEFEESEVDPRGASRIMFLRSLADFSYSVTCYPEQLVRHAQGSHPPSVYRGCLVDKYKKMQWKLCSQIVQSRKVS